MQNVIDLFVMLNTDSIVYLFMQNSRLV